MKILLAVDSSAASEIAAKEVAARPWLNDTSIQILSVADTTDTWKTPEFEESLIQLAQEAIRNATNILQSAGVGSTSLVKRGDPRDAVVDHANETGVDLIVVGSHDESDVMRFLLGSVARAVVRHAPCSVEIVRPRKGTGARKILLATDGSECSDAAARSIAARPWPAGTEFRVLSVVELAAAWLYFDPKAMEDLRAEAMKRAQEAVMAAEKTLVDAGFAETGTVAVPTGSAKELILKEAAEWGADLIVAGSHGRRGATRFLLGSVSEPIAFHAHCSVEIVRMPGSK